MRVRLSLLPAVTKKFVSLTIKVITFNVSMTVATQDNLAVSNSKFNTEFKSVPNKLKIVMEFMQTQRVVPAGLKMVLHPVACTQSIQMAANQYKCCVT